MFYDFPILVVCLLQLQADDKHTSIADVLLRPPHCRCNKDVFVIIATAENTERKTGGEDSEY